MSEFPVVPDGVAAIDLVGVRKGAFGSQGSGDTSGFGGLVAPNCHARCINPTIWRLV